MISLTPLQPPTANKTLWHGPYRFRDTRPLREEEAGELRDRIGSHRRDARRLLGALIAAAVLASVWASWTVTQMSSGLESWRDWAAVLLLVTLVCGGCLGVVLELLLPRVWWFRLVHGAWIVAAAAALLALGPARVLPTAAICAMVFGGPALVVRGVLARRVSRVAAALAQDLTLGNVWRFQVAPNQTVEGPQEVELLPASRLLLTVGGEPRSGWQVLPLTEVTRIPPEERKERRLVREGDRGPVAERELHDDELPELRRLPRVVAGFTLKRAVLFTYLAGILLHLSDRLFDNVPTTGLRPLGWAALAVLGAVLGYRAAVAIRAARRDVLDRRVLIFQRGPTVREEILANSWSRWSNGDVPAAWRRR